jgi:hypothetical protein
MPLRCCFDCVPASVPTTLARCHLVTVLQIHRESGLSLIKGAHNFLPNYGECWWAIPKNSLSRTSVSDPKRTPKPSTSSLCELFLSGKQLIEINVAARHRH